MSTLLTSERPTTREPRRKEVRVPFTMISRSPARLDDVPVTRGVCLPKGLATSPAGWAVETADQRSLLAQTEVLDRWSDGSVRWLLLHFIAPHVVTGETEYWLLQAVQQERKSASAEVPPNVSVTRGTSSLIDVQLPGQTGSAPSGVEVGISLSDEFGRFRELVVRKIHQESAGPVRHTFTVAASVRRLPLLEFQLRFHVWPTTGLIEMQVRVRNARRARHKGGLWDLGDPGSFRFRELKVCLTSDNARSAADIQWRATVDGDVRRATTAHSASIRQFGSGGRHWASTNHLTADGTVDVQGRGFIATSHDGVLRGYRSEPTFSLVGDQASLSVAVPEFWQNFPGSLTAANRSISIGLFPTVDGTVHELQGGEQKTRSVWIGTQWSAPDAQHLRWVHEPPVFVQPADWVRRTGVFSWFPGSLNNCGDSAPAVARYGRYVKAATTGSYSIEERRATIDEYGWRNFGDIPADHEQTHYAGRNTIVSHYNNQFDMVLGAILNLAATGDAVWQDLFDPLARHVMDIDIYHTQQDRAAFNGGLFWHTDHYVDAATATHRSYSHSNAGDRLEYGGGPSNEHNYTTGLLYYYFLTGNQEARQTVLSLADWVLAMDRSRNTVWGLLDSDDTGLASRSVFEDFHGPGRGAGYSINALLDGWVLTHDTRYLRKAEQLIQRTVHPQQDCEGLHLLDAEWHWSYTVCLSAIGRYLDIKREVGELDADYSYARDVMAHFGRWMAENERPTLSVPEGLEFVTEAWAAQDFRKANVMRIAAACCDSPADEQAIRTRADEINDEAWSYLYKFRSRHLTARCLSIIMTEGLREVYHRTCQPDYYLPSNVHYPQTSWHMFVPQKARVRQILKSPTGLLKACTRLWNPVRWWRAIDVLRRHM